MNGEFGKSTTVFIVGCPRSGTTWIQLLLAHHPLVATAPETQIFAYYLESFKKQWLWEQEGAGGKRHGGAGLNRLLSEEEFDDLCRETANFVLEKIASRNPDGRVVVEKSPRHALQAAWISRLLPDARFLHVVRDPRDTAASLLAAGASWAPWAPRNPTGAGKLWLECVEGARQVGGDDVTYRELRYEDVRKDPVVAVQGVFDWLGLPDDRELCEHAVEQCRLDRLQENVSGDSLPIPNRKSPIGFFRRGVVGGWQDELSGWKVRVIEDICGPLMDEYGYERAATSSSFPIATVRRGLHEGLTRLHGGLDWRIKRLIRRI
ncbi:MAG: sulfotransferase [Gemmatimonadota bacterium]